MLSNNRQGYFGCLFSQLAAIHDTIKYQFGTQRLDVRDEPFIKHVGLVPDVSTVAGWYHAYYMYVDDSCAYRCWADPEVGWLQVSNVLQRQTGH